MSPGPVDTGSVNPDRAVSTGSTRRVSAFQWSRSSVGYPALCWLRVVLLGMGPPVVGLFTTGWRRLRLIVRDCTQPNGNLWCMPSRMNRQGGDAVPLRVTGIGEAHVNSRAEQILDARRWRRSVSPPTHAGIPRDGRSRRRVSCHQRRVAGPQPIRAASTMAGTRRSHLPPQRPFDYLVRGAAQFGGPTTGLGISSRCGAQPARSSPSAWPGRGQPRAARTCAAAGG